MLIFIAFIAPELMFQGFLSNLLSHLFFVHNLVPAYHGAINGSNWSLGTEMQFYILMAVMAPWIYSARIWKILVVFVLAAWAWRLGTTLLVQPDAMGPFKIFLVSTQLPGMLDEFAFGIVMAKLFRSDVASRVIDYCRSTWMALSVSALAGAVFYLMLTVYWKYASFWDLPLMVVFFRSFIAFAFALIVFAACLYSPGVLAKRILWPFSYLGEISFGIYLWHLPVLMSLKRLTWLDHGQVVVVALLLTVVLASVSWHFFEKPFLQRKANSKAGLVFVPPTSNFENAGA